MWVIQHEIQQISEIYAATSIESRALDLRRSLTSCRRVAPVTYVTNAAAHRWNSVVYISRLQAGGRASDDAVRSFVISHKLLGTNEWFIVHHTDCGE